MSMSRSKPIPKLQTQTFSMAWATVQDALNPTLALATSMYGGSTSTLLFCEPLRPKPFRWEVEEWNPYHYPAITLAKPCL